MKKKKERKIYEIEIEGNNVKTQFRSIYRILKKIKAGFSPKILIVGEPGIGKSFLACWLGLFLSGKLNKDFSVEKNCIYDLYGSVKFVDENFMEVSILDEMIELAFKREHYKPEHFDFIKMLNTQRYKKIIFIMIIPHGSDLNSAIAKNIDIMFWVKKKGLYLAGSFKKRYWDLFLAKKEPPKFFEMIAVKFSEVPKKTWEEYEEYSKEMKEAINQRIMSRILKKIEDKEQLTDAEKIMKNLDENMVRA